MCLHSVTWNSPLALLANNSIPPNCTYIIFSRNQLLFNAIRNILSQTGCFEYFDFEFSERSVANGCDCSLTAGNTHRLTHVWTHVCCLRRSTVLMLASTPVLHTSRLTYLHTSTMRLHIGYCQWMDEMLHKADRPYSIPLYKLPDYPLLNNVVLTTFTIDSLEFLELTPKAKIRIRLYHICPNWGLQFSFFLSSVQL